jgi:hypothetical protein
MFDPIEAPDVHRGPATGHSTEFGTTWQEAVSRINAGFKALFARGETGTSGELVARLEASDARIAMFEKAIGDLAHVADGKLTFLEEALSDALFKIDSHATMLTAMTTPAEPLPATPASTADATSA